LQKEANLQLSPKSPWINAKIVAILLIFLVLVLMFNSIFLPFVIISVIPLSFLGVILGELVTLKYLVH
jgi:multidrug efflux pump subunit AcrB